MDQDLGKLVLIQEGGPEREFGLSKTAITLGRATTNDIVLADTRVSREHARLECGPGGWQIVDLGSSNGTRLNGLPIERSMLRPGDVIGLGSTQLRYQSSAPMEDLEATRIDSASDVSLTIDQAILPMAINETSLPRLVIFTDEKTWEVPLANADSVTIGRAEGNQVVIDRDRVSRRHAEVVRRGQAWYVRDLGSTNGTWLRGEQVDERMLHDGDSFRIGRSQVVFKSGFMAEAMTMLDETFARIPGRRPVVLIPGLFGSDLWRGKERVWPSVKNFLTNPEIYLYPSAVPLEPRGVVDELVIVPNLIKQDQYNRLGDYLVEELGYERGRDFFEFAYDWRQDVRISARQLRELIESLPAALPVTLIAHSLGTLVSRYYVERLGGKKRVERTILMGGPHLGAAKMIATLLLARSVLPFGFMGERYRQVMMTFPSSYQILPTYACGVDQNGARINFLSDETWLGEEQKPLLRVAREFRRELGTRSSVPTLSIFGYGIKTISTISLVRNGAGVPSDFSYQSEASGDSSILEKSAVLPGSEIHPVQQYHGSLFVDSDVKMRLKLELARQFR